METAVLNIPNLEGMPPRISEFYDKIEKAIPCVPENSATRSQLKAMGLGSLLVHYLNFVGRSIPPRPRRVVYAPGFIENFDIVRNGLALRNIEKKIEAGEDINTFLSKDARSKGFIGDRSKKVVYPEKDLILNAFSLHHLHLLPRGKGDDLLFVHFDHLSAFFLIGGNHKSFMDGSVAEAYARIQAASSASFADLRASGEPTDFKAQMRLAHFGLSSMSQIEGLVVPGPLLSSSAHSVRHSRYANYIVRTLAKLDEQLEDRSFAEQLFAAAPDRLKSRTDFQWSMDYTDLILLERVNKTKMLIRKGFC